MLKCPVERFDRIDSQQRQQLLRQCRLKPGELWIDPCGRHIVGCGDATDRVFVEKSFVDKRAQLLVHDPPYNQIVGGQKDVGHYIDWCHDWVQNSLSVLDQDAAMYVWMGADQNDHFQPLPQFMMLMAETSLRSRSLITMRNQRGYGTSKNWMCVRQELLYYTKGEPPFEVQYTDIPKILRGYYKEVNGKITENLERSKSETIRASNVWVDIQQVFYRMEENIDGCYAQKPLKAIERIVKASSKPGDLVADFFAHSGTTLLACERLDRRCFTFDIDPVFAEISIRRLERFRQSGRTGWQMSQPLVAGDSPTKSPRGRPSREPISTKAEASA